jgi:hypothetical protein
MAASRTRLEAVAEGDLAAFLPDWTQHLRARNLAPRTITSYRTTAAEFGRCAGDLRGAAALVHRCREVREGTATPMTRRPVAALLVIAVLLAGGVAAAIAAREPDRSAADTGLPSFSVVPASAPDHQLLQDALDISAWKAAGDVRNFTAVPATRPPGLARMHIGGDGEAVIDTYRLTSRLMVMAAYSAGPLDICADKNSDEGMFCVRSETLPDNAAFETPLNDDRSHEGAGALRHLTVYFTRTGRKPLAQDPDVRAATSFWANVNIVPTSRATWFTELVRTAKTAASR